MVKQGPEPEQAAVWRAQGEEYSAPALTLLLVL
jgi:hypothetical protein